MQVKIILFLIWIGHSIPLWAAETTTIYKYFDANGVLHLTNKPPQSQNQVLYARSYMVQPYAIPKLTRNKPPQYDHYAPLIESIARRYQLPAALLHAVIQVESAYNPKAVSPKGAVGLMQLMPATAQRYGVTDRTDPAMNIEGGAHYLHDLLDLFNHQVSLALAAYNAGENAVKRYGNTIPPYRETQNYVKKVNRLYYNYFNH